MSKLSRFFASFLLIGAMSAISLADGGDTQGPSHPITTPPPGQETVLTQPEPTENATTESLDALQTAETIAVWLLTEIF